MVKNSKNMAILAAGGPAPGINSVISAAAIRAEIEGIKVLGIKDGFKWIMEGDTSHIKDLNIGSISRIHFTGGSYIGIARSNPTKDKKKLENVIETLQKLNVDKLITIGGDDTAFSAMNVNAAAGDKIKVVHVPKTIDNDLDLPHGIPTFGFQTARHVGVQIVKNLMVDAKTTSRWYFVIAMGRKAGHLALGIGKAAGASLTIIPEEFPDSTIKVSHIVDILVGAIVKRLSYGRSDGVAILAEGLAEQFDPEELKSFANVERDAHDHIRLSEVNLGDILKDKVEEKLKEYGIELTIVTKNIGYELRCADPIPFDMEYTRDLGFAAAQFVINGGSGAMVSIQNGRFVPMYFKDILDPKTGKTKVRMVDPSSETYYIARRYMLRLNQTDFEDRDELAKYAAACGISSDEFKSHYEYLIENDLLYKYLKEGKIKLEATESNTAYEQQSPPTENNNEILIDKK
jgi:ATP-dependent phosphofructokinase / diphosphate-dependent phosphofructokinase